LLSQLIWAVFFRPGRGESSPGRLSARFRPGCALVWNGNAAQALHQQSGRGAPGVCLERSGVAKLFLVVGAAAVVALAGCNRDSAKAIDAGAPAEPTFTTYAC